MPEWPYQISHISHRETIKTEPLTSENHQNLI